MALLREVGLSEVREIRRFDAFAGTNKEHIARRFGVEGANFFARK
ncbi:MAG: hypothetical protein AAFZ18_26105 [Myxococcota bacterium]